MYNLRGLLIVTTLIWSLSTRTIAQSSSPKMMFGDTTHRKSGFAKDPHVVHFGKAYLMYYSVPVYKDSSGADHWGIGIARSTDLTTWQKVGEIRPVTEYEKKGLCAPGALVRDGKVHLFYQTYGNGRNDAICHAVSTDGIHFERNPTNPIFHPAISDWSCGRAIDADVIKFKNQYFLYFATRDTSYKIQQLGVAVASANTNFNREDWKQVDTKGPILKPELPWEGECIEGASVIERKGTLYMFYAGAYNNWPQQIGVARSTDGIHWERVQTQPFLKNGAPGTWNSSESGHPHIFTDKSGQTYLFYQGNNDKGKSWFLSNIPVDWTAAGPTLTK
ncbi:family 43 glycosylhydrolase [Spirosoma sp. HMF4905]|uniref:Family 43 glycosylhydrolase n=1 Tax=Spirosoma arboris TaxID=2682092 RepID=A0A7K1SAA3_9BACT|nr:family 43 glycosylhydrolase [Spirosoma arboris]MVM30762.1 family 43 glycosylhydrolase [Spirosoma arboris]